MGTKMEAKWGFSSPTFQWLSCCSEWNPNCSRIPRNLTWLSALLPLLSSLLFSLCVQVPTRTLVLGHRLTRTRLSSAGGTPFQHTAYSFPLFPQASHKCPPWTQLRLGPSCFLSTSFPSIACSSNFTVKHMHNVLSVCLSTYSLSCH